MGRKPFQKTGSLSKRDRWRPTKVCIVCEALLPPEHSYYCSIKCKKYRESVQYHAQRRPTVAEQFHEVLWEQAKDTPNHEIAISRQFLARYYHVDTTTIRDRLRLLEKQGKISTYHLDEAAWTLHWPWLPPKKTWLLSVVAVQDPSLWNCQNELDQQEARRRYNRLQPKKPQAPRPNRTRIPPKRKVREVKWHSDDILHVFIDFTD